MGFRSDGSLAWLAYLPGEAPSATTSMELAREELRQGLRQLRRAETVDVIADGQGQAYAISKTDTGYVINGGEPGVLYGAYALLSALSRGEQPPEGLREPHFPLRILNHWDNMDGTIERGYAGRSFFFKKNHLSFDPARIRQYARMLSSVGINCISPNNVNVRPPMDGLLMQGNVSELKALADILRPFGIRLLVSIDFSMPSHHGLNTADPLNEEVAAWWARTTGEVYRAIPDLAGYLVKADSEYRPGPFTYGRTHAQGANMLARALKPHGGLLFWRCFVYNHKQDWRDTVTDRPKAAFEHYSPQDGQFDDNVVLQIKNGPLDFQVREPLSPLLFAMPRTRKALELQLAQEYTGQQIDLFYHGPQYEDIFEHLPLGNIQYIAAVSNLGDDSNWCGHDLAQASLYAYGRTAWEGACRAQEFAREWAQTTLPEASEEVTGMLMRSGAVYEQYAAPLGIGFLVRPNSHYGPSPEGYEFDLWGTYHRANQMAIGVDRSTNGSGYTAQYPQPLMGLYNNPDTCPEKLLLFFHRLPYDHPMADGRSLVQRVYDDHFEGALGAEDLLAQWKQLKNKIPEGTYERVLSRFERQAANAREWRDVINTYFYRKSGIGDARGRLIHP